LILKKSVPTVEKSVVVISLVLLLQKMTVTVGTVTVIIAEGRLMCIYRGL